MKYIYILLAFTLSLFSCKTTGQLIKIKTFESKKEVVLWYSKKMNTISVISLPINIEINNSSSKEKSFLNYKYLYEDQLKGNPMKMYLIEGNKLIKQSVSKIKYINAKSSKGYLIYSKHFVDTLKFSRNFFKPYINKMRNLDQDTLHIGTVTQFKKKHKELFEKLTKNDSVSIQFLDGGKFGERIIVPVEW